VGLFGLSLFFELPLALVFLPSPRLVRLAAFACAPFLGDGKDERRHR
jgi:hypothetical protein